MKVKKVARKEAKQWNEIGRQLYMGWLSRVLFLSLCTVCMEEDLGRAGISGHCRKEGLRQFSQANVYNRRVIGIGLDRYRYAQID